MSAIYSDLENKTVLITGASRGIGNSIAKELARQKCHVVFNYRSNEEEANKLREELITLGGKATALKFDVTDYETMKEAVDGFIKENGAISGLVNNAGVSKDTLCLRVKPEEIDDVLAVNLKSLMVLTNHLCRNFLRAEDVSIVNMSSVVGLMGNTAQTTYAASKAGVIGYTKSLAKELASKKVRCNAVCPGFIDTDMTKALPEKAREEYRSQIPLESYGEDSDVANVVTFLLSQSSRYITGEVIKVDGGLYI